MQLLDWPLLFGGCIAGVDERLGSLLAIAGKGALPVSSPQAFLAHTWRTSPSRATMRYSTGLTKKPMNRREMSPATITMANGFCVAEPMPVDNAAGSRPRQATKAVIMMG